jgi:hypothetical protein
MHFGLSRSTTERPRHHAPSHPGGPALALAVVLVAALGAPGGTAGASQAIPAASQPTLAASTSSSARVYYGEELMRLTNLDRVALGKRALAPDPLLMALATDQPVKCPSRPSLVIRGRSRDMAQRGYFSHDIRSCRRSNGRPYGFSDLLGRLGYRGWTLLAENIGTDDFSVGTSTYRTGCPRGRSAGCRGSTLTAHQVAVVQRAFMNSAAHRANIVNARFNRFGCGAWHRDGSRTTYFTCIFARGGNDTLDRTGPVLANLSGGGAVIQAGGSATFTGTATDARTPVAEAWVTIDGATRESWAVDLPTSSLGLSWTVAQAGLTAGSHTLTWHVRDAGANEQSASVRFSVR